MDLFVAIQSKCLLKDLHPMPAIAKLKKYRTAFLVDSHINGAMMGDCLIANNCDDS